MPWVLKASRFEMCTPSKPGWAIGSYFGFGWEPLQPSTLGSWHHQNERVGSASVLGHVNGLFASTPAAPGIITAGIQHHKEAQAIRAYDTFGRQPSALVIIGIVGKEGRQSEGYRSNETIKCMFAPALWFWRSESIDIDSGVRK